MVLNSNLSLYSFKKESLPAADEAEAGADALPEATAEAGAAEA